MLITTGKVHDGTIEVEDKSLPEGTKVTVLAPEGDETFDPESEAQLLAAIAEAERGETVGAPQVLRQLRRS